MVNNSKLWGGRFNEPTESKAEDFSASIRYDKRLYKHDIEGSIAHAIMLKKSGIITEDELERIVKGLNQIKNEIESGVFEFKNELEDIHMNIESRLTELAGSAGAKLHTARSRNDQVVTDTRMYLRYELKRILSLIAALQWAFVDKADKYKNKIMPGFTHLQHAQPVLIGHHLLAYVCMFERDKQRLIDAYKRINVMGLGSCALAGTPLPIDRQVTADVLSFSEISSNSIDAVSDRDFIAEFLADAAILGIHLSRWAEELVIWASPEFKFVIIPDAYCTGSSIMPQKKNPDMAELIRGKSARLTGNLVTILTLLKGLPLSYNRDLQEDKEPLFDSIDTIVSALEVAVGMMSRMEFDSERTRSIAEADYILATEIADYLVLKAMPFRMAHEVVGKIVAYCVSKNKKFNSLTIEEWKKFSELFDNTIFDSLSLESSIKNKKSPGSTSFAEVENQVNYWKNLLEGGNNE